MKLKEKKSVDAEKAEVKNEKKGEKGQKKWVKVSLIVLAVVLVVGGLAAAGYFWVWPMIKGGDESSETKPIDEAFVKFWDEEDIKETEVREFVSDNELGYMVSVKRVLSGVPTNKEGVSGIAVEVVVNNDSSYVSEIDKSMVYALDSSKVYYSETSDFSDFIGKYELETFDKAARGETFRGWMFFEVSGQDLTFRYKRPETTIMISGENENDVQEEILPEQNFDIELKLGE